jgi:hypothetical protein
MHVVEISGRIPRIRHGCVGRFTTCLEGLIRELEAGGNGIAVGVGDVGW